MVDEVDTNDNSTLFNNLNTLCENLKAAKSIQLPYINEGKLSMFCLRNIEGLLIINWVIIE